MELLQTSKKTDLKMIDRFAEYSTDPLKLALDNIVKISEDLKVIKSRS